LIDLITELREDLKITRAEKEQLKTELQAQLTQNHTETKEMFGEMNERIIALEKHTKLKRPFVYGKERN
jgi:hypothetical protein